MSKSRQRTTKSFALVGTLALATSLSGLSPACGGKSVTDEREPATGGSGGPQGGQSGTAAGGSVTGGSGNAPAGGTEMTGGVSGFPSGGNGAAGTAPGGAGPRGGAGGVSPGGVGGSPLAGGGGAPVAGVGGVAAGAGGSPVAGAGGTPAGMGGVPIAGAGGGGGCAADCASTLNGQTILAPCFMNTEVLVCRSRPTDEVCTSNTADPALSGGWLHHETVTMPGTPGILYDVTLHVQGEVEAKTYPGGADQNNMGTQKPADGLCVGGVPDNTANGYSIFMIRVSSPRQDYFLNSVGAGNDTRVRHATWIADYQATIRVEGGSPVLFHASDPQCSMIKNCNEFSGPMCVPSTVPNLDPLIAQDIGSQPYNGQFLGVTVVGVSVVN